MAVATSLGSSHFVMMLDNEKNEETDFQFLSETPFSGCLKYFSFKSSVYLMKQQQASHEKWKLLWWKRVFLLSQSAECWQPM